MDCRQCQDDMTAYLDGELTASAGTRVREHVDQCHSCAEELRGLEESAEFIDTGIAAIELRPEVWRHVRARISVEAPAPRPGLIRFLLGNRWVAATATLAAAAVLGLGIWSYRQHQIDRQDLEQYMSDYLNYRESQEQNEPRLLVPPQDGPDTGNPFISVRATMIDNPFRQEAK